MPRSADIPSEDLERIPGLFRPWELIQLIEPGAIYCIEDAGTTSDGSVLLAVYRHVRDEPRLPRVQSNLQ